MPHPLILRLAPLAALLALGCAPAFDDLDEACHDRVAGSKRVDAEGEEALHRANCYRRVAGLHRYRVHRYAQPAVDDHLAYMALHGLTMVQESGKEGFTGQTAFDRMRAAGYDELDASSTGLWQIVGQKSLVALHEPEAITSPTALIDYLAHDPYFRQVFMQPAVRGAGFGFEGDYFHMVVIHDFPADKRIRKPVVYPADGQLEVPTSWNAAPYGGVDGYPAAEVGFPITITVGAHQGSSWTDRSPYDLELDEARLTGPDGEVELVGVGPEDTLILLPYSVLLVPVEPLQPGAEYTVEATLTWTAGTREVVSTFRTGAE